MKSSSRKLTILGAMLSILFVTACGQSGGGTEEDDSPEAEAYRYRESVMHVAERKMITLGEMAREEIPVDEAVFAKSAVDLASIAGMVVEGFMPEGAPSSSKALPEIWSNWDDFVDKADSLKSAADTLAAAVADGGFEAGQDLVLGMARAGSCGGCHRIYRRRDE